MANDEENREHHKSRITIRIRKDSGVSDSVRTACFEQAVSNSEYLRRAVLNKMRKDGVLGEKEE